MARSRKTKPNRKRGQNEGSITYRASRDHYEGRLTIGYKTTVGADGVGRRVPVRRTFAAKTEAEVRERMIRAQVNMLDGRAPADGNTTVAAYLDQWVTEVLPGTNVTQGTITNYGNVVRFYIKPTIGHLRLAELSPEHVAKMLRTLDAEGRSGNTQRLARAVLRRALRRAEQHGILSRNVAAIADGPKVTMTKEGRTLSHAQAHALLDHLAGHANPRVRARAAAWVVMLSLGLRRGETLGLRWEDVTLDASPPLLAVRKALKREPAGLVLTDPKTAGSKRTLHLPQAVAAQLRDHRRIQAEARLLAGPEWVALPLGADLMFRTEFGTPLDPDNFRNWTYRLTLEALGERWSPHELRHSAASILLAQGVPLEVVTETLGHSSIRITKDVYGHLMEPARQHAADAMTEALFGR